MQRPTKRGAVGVGLGSARHSAFNAPPERTPHSIETFIHRFTMCLSGLIPANATAMDSRPYQGVITHDSVHSLVVHVKLVHSGVDTSGSWESLGEQPCPLGVLPACAFPEPRVLARCVSANMLPLRPCSSESSSLISMASTMSAPACRRVEI